MCSSVDLPEPDGLTTDTYSPRPTRSDASRSARTGSVPANVRVRSRSSITGPASAGSPAWFVMSRSVMGSGRPWRRRSAVRSSCHSPWRRCSRCHQSGCRQSRCHSPRYHPARAQVDDLARGQGRQGVLLGVGEGALRCRHRGDRRVTRRGCRVADMRVQGPDTGSRRGVVRVGRGFARAVSTLRRGLVKTPPSLTRSMLAPMGGELGQGLAS